MAARQTSRSDSGGGGPVPGMAESMGCLPAPFYPKSLGVADSLPPIGRTPGRPDGANRW